MEKITVDSKVVACDGGNGQTNGGLGHPRVYLNMGPNTEVVCPYCSREFVLRAGAKIGHGH